jgi:hypothetical protein
MTLKVGYWAVGVLFTFFIFLFLVLSSFFFFFVFVIVKPVGPHRPNGYNPPLREEDFVFLFMCFCFVIFSFILCVFWIHFCLHSQYG